MLAGEMENMDSTPAPNGQWASLGSMPGTQQVRLLALLLQVPRPSPRGVMSPLHKLPETDFPASRLACSCICGSTYIVSYQS